ncbi:LuxR family transcriptional regulator [Streptomyces spectabilis]|nr:helix-turn-helix transcriptional regulator [Streptomyces spectabilis]QEV65127.1 LuxR family transcriptional regulator [Streptomyces spectabilis]
MARVLHDARLTRREREVVELLAQGLSNRRIACDLSISEPTVKNHLRAAFLKLDVTDRTQAVVKVLEAHQP